MKRDLLPAICFSILCSLTLPLKGTGISEANLPTPLLNAAIPKQKLIVGVTVVPPFNIKNADGSWTGISIELWRQIAKELGIEFEFNETNVIGYFAGLSQGWLDVAVGPLTITEQREEICDFTHSYFVSNLAVAVPTNRLPPSARFLLAFFDPNAWWIISRIVIGFFAIMVVVAGLMWLCERRANPVQFGGEGRLAKGFGSALWWSAVTMTTVGYGDVAPRTLKGRLLAVAWMFVSMVLVSIFTATLASILTTERLRQYTAIRGLDDLRRVHVGTFPDSSAAQYLTTNHIDYKALARTEPFEALKEGKIQAVLFDEPFLRYEVRNHYQGEFTVVPLHLDTQLYAFAVREGAPLREPINRVLLRKIHELAWRDLVYHYLGIAPE
jgi:ABC-type amino acid transport substrate-binding protein